MDDQRKITIGPAHNAMVYLGSRVTPGLKDYAEMVVFQQPHIRADELGATAYRGTEGRYIATIYQGRASYLVILSFNLGLTRQRYIDEVFDENPPGHRGYVIIDHALTGGHLATALHTMAEMIEKLTSGGYADHPDAALIATALPFEKIPRPEAA